jgi:hypothetical protein
MRNNKMNSIGGSASVIESPQRGEREQLAGVISCEPRNSPPNTSSRLIRHFTSLKQIAARFH